MDLRESIKFDYWDELDKAVKDVQNAEWQEIEEFDAIVNNATDELTPIISADLAYSGYSLQDIKNEVYDLICEGFHDW